MIDFLSDVVTWFGAPGRWSLTTGIPFRTAQHLQLAVVPTLIACGLAIPPATILAHRHRAAFLANSAVNLGRAVPSFGVLIVVALMGARYGMDLEFWPIVIALILLALPPIFTNTYAAIAGVDPAIVESARGMGLTERQVLLRTELPVGAPVLLAGVRIAFVQVIATVPLAAVVSGGGGLGRYVVDGFAVGPAGTVRAFSGALLIAVLTVVAERAMDGLERMALPAGVRRAARPEPATEPAAA